MDKRTRSPWTVSPWLLAFAAAAAPLLGQQDPEALERLRRDQEEILRKAERLHGMMQRLQQRYVRENKPEQVKLLEEGVAHLERSGLMREVAGIRAVQPRPGRRNRWPVAETHSPRRCLPINRDTSCRTRRRRDWESPTRSSPRQKRYR